MTPQEEVAYYRSLLSYIGGLLQQMAIDESLSQEQRELLKKKCDQLIAIGIIK